MEKIILFAIVGVFCACSGNGLEKSEALTLQAYPVVEGAARNKDCRDFLGRCMLLQTAKPLFELNGFKFRAMPGGSADRHNQLEIFLSGEQAAAFETIPGKFIGEGKRLALVYHGRILHAPKLKARIRANSVTIDFCNAHVYEMVLAGLRGETPPGYKFSDDKAWNMCDLIPEN